MQATVLLFDIDGTLLTTGGAGRRAMALAFQDFYGREDACQSFSMSGMTDRAIMKAGLANIGQEATESTVDALLEAYLVHLTQEVQKVEASRYRVHPGMQEAVERARNQDGVAVGLGTGNLREGARVKLSRVGLYEHFAFGGFGCDHEERAELIRRGALRGAEQLGEPLEACRVVVIGDTPKDVQAAHAIGASCIGVTTGSFQEEALRQAGADFVFADFARPEALQALLTGR